MLHSISSNRFGKCVFFQVKIELPKIAEFDIFGLPNLPKTQFRIAENGVFELPQTQGSICGVKVSLCVFKRFPTHRKEKIQVGIQNSIICHITYS